MKETVKYILCEDDKNCDILCLKFDSLQGAEDRLKKTLLQIKKPLMIRGSGIDNVDCVLIPKLIEILDRPCIIGIVNENNYKSIIPPAVSGGHTVIIRTPIDINLAKEMNILASELGMENVIIDTDIGGLGYGFEYGYSIMEKIRLEDDKFLNKPIISFAVEETMKTKEAKENPKTALFMEIAAASAVKAAGANYIVMNSKEALKAMKGIE